MMRPQGTPASGRRMAREWLARIRHSARTAPLPVKLALILVVLTVVVLAAMLPAQVADALLVAALLYGPVAVWRGHRSLTASIGTALIGLAAVLVVVTPVTTAALPLVLVPVAAVAAAHARPLARAFVPCRTVAWALLWALPLGLLTWHYLPRNLGISYVAAWAAACVVIGWRLIRGWQGSRGFPQQQARGGVVAAPGTSRLNRGPQVIRPGEAAVAVRVPDRSRAPAPAEPAADGAEVRQLPDITVEEAMAELDAMIGLTAVKEQIRQHTSMVEAARRRALAGYEGSKPMRHFVFLGPPGTGKTTVARIVAKIFYAFGLLETPTLVEAQRSDLVGEYLGATAIKTNELIDSALGGVLFIDEAYSLVNDGEGQPDRFGNEAVQALLKRAE
ncbi:MAG: AAA family ATPase, partial [Actinobacteria bacterium]|nr:AAA family ATPase [Actinomycetota bacterium]